MKLKTMAQVKKERPEFRALIGAVIEGIGGVERIADVINHGIDGGFGDFIYYADTVAFYKKYRKKINALAEELADEIGEGGVTEMVGAFNCIKSYDYKTERWTDKDDRKDIAVCLFGGSLRNLTDDVRIPNDLAWFAAEEVCRWFEE